MHHHVYFQHVSPAGYVYWSGPHSYWFWVGTGAVAGAAITYWML